MTPEQYQRVKEVFLAVRERPDAEQDSAVADACGSDEQLRLEVQSLLVCDREARLAACDEQSPLEPPNRTHRQFAATGAQLSPLRRAAVAAAGGSSSSKPSSGGSGTKGDQTLKGRFASGTVLADRYRIVSLLGAGGMGEVYRADDLTLDQPVALKFLPGSVGADSSWSARLQEEVRISRQVTHVNVCRVFDIGHVDGESFITMEFVDGEDLASLLRRIGRLPGDKAVQIARQICAGLAAAHERGVLHRDLKPANIMIDGRGQVRITDFGISARLDSAGADSTSGTPAYMAPEQFSNGVSDQRSDIYCLGLLLYEIFTGKQVFSANSPLEYSRLHRQTMPTEPSTLLPQVDPLVERVILRCLEKDPARRPASALAVAAALPGGDPLAAALAAGETPSPEMVAAAGGQAALSIRGALGLLIGTLLALALVVAVSRPSMLTTRLPLNLPPAVLADRAQAVLSAAGLPAPLENKAWGFGLDQQYVSWVATVDNSPDAWDRMAKLQPGAAFFWYRQSPDYMLSYDSVGMITLDEPARVVPGMRTVVLDLAGRLKRLEILPSGSEPTSGASDPPASAADLAPLFKAAQLPMQDFAPITPQFVPPMYAQQLLAWEGNYPDDPGQPVQIQAAMLDGKCVFFNVAEPWVADASARKIDKSPDFGTGNYLLQAVLIITTIVSGVVLAGRNLLAKKVDTAGAQKLAGAFLLLGILVWLLCANHVPQLFLEMRLFFRDMGFTLLRAIIVWMFYLALEPYVRRIWPETVISWSRLMAGRAADRLVAAHALVGIAAAAALTLLLQAGNLLALRLRLALPIQRNDWTWLVRFIGKENPLAVSLWSLLQAMIIGMLYLLSLVLLQRLLRRRWLASLAFVAVALAMSVQWQFTSAVQCVSAALVAAGILLMLVRYGLVAALACLWGLYMLRYLPITTDMSLWYASQTRFAVILLAAVAGAATLLACGKAKLTPRPYQPAP